MRAIGTDLREYYTLLPAGTELWHVFPSKYDARSFNSRSLNRFALPPPPDRGMYYAGDSCECALWETALRNLVIEPGQPQYIDEALLAQRSIARLALAHETAILDLRSPHFRHLSSSAVRHAQWQRLCVIPEQAYGETHAAVRELIAAAPRAAGISWHSRQIQARTAFVLYSPPLQSDNFTTSEVIPLDSTEGWQLVDNTLRNIGVERIKPNVLLTELLDELPPEEAEDADSS